jgi:hypothetical protein
MERFRKIGADWLASLKDKVDERSVKRIFVASAALVDIAFSVYAPICPARGEAA